MDPLLLAQATLNGLMLGGVYSLMAVGLSLIFGVMRIINFAHGELMIWGMYLAYWLFTLGGLDPLLSLPLTTTAVFGLGYAIQRVLVNRILEAPEEMQVLLLLGVSLILTNGALILFGPDSRRAPTAYALSTLWLGPVILDVARLLAFVLAMALTGGLVLFLRRTDLGRTLRAAADSRVGALLTGVDVERVYPIAFGIGAACAAAAGALTIPFLPFAPSGGLPLTLTSFIVVILGGMGSLPGAALGGLIVGVTESLGAVLLVSSLKQVVSFIIVIGILLLRPRGLLGGRA
ncbi:MAG TPA: branched-chain amino acid ABC transporter permease [Candidatus Methylomirabilis sp.]|jgi:branched-chain amino acid transport system permease protein|nr:branched-chain amino acid ABC transporter permease [Candidatus Methylomirabilis sp.]